MNGIYQAAREVQEFFRKKRWRFCLIGLLVQLGKEKKVVEALLAHFGPRIPNAAPFALQSRVVLCNATNGVPVDVALAALPFEERVIARASKFSFAPRLSIVTISAEDLIVMKAIADRDQGCVDVRGIVIRQRGKVDWKTIESELAELYELKEDFGPLDRLEQERD